MKSSFARIAVRTAALLAVTLPAFALSTSAPAPQFSLTARGGKTVNLAQFKGQVVMINFWATWCGPCRQEMPLLESIYKKYHKMGFTLLGVNVEPDAKPAEEYLKAIPVSFPILFDTKSEVSKMYEVSGMPSTIIVDRKGNVRVIHHGYKPGDENEYQDSIRKLVRE
ncbi:MAG TPA: TlpA disulfide reductase family protein [Steroidobacteraceae bacterium]|jgi:thiol-disulfide isomerase/thioredoxin|nr:TlpA disulfide reductase family protein [Steroidobacteraceae bacterium]